MKKILIASIILLLTVALFANESIAIVSSSSGKVSLLRSDKTVKFNNGSILESNDVLLSLESSQVGCKYLDGMASFRLFSDSNVKFSGLSVGDSLNKLVNLFRGSVLTKSTLGNGTLTLTTSTGVIKAGTATILTKQYETGESRVIVLDGFADLNIPLTETTKILEAGQIAIIDKSGTVMIRNTDMSDLTFEEHAMLFPEDKSAPQSLTVPLVDSQGRIKYVEISW